METVETGDKNCNVPQRHALFCEDILGTINVKVIKLFQNGSVESIDYFGKGQYFSENSDVEAINWSSVVNFHCMQMR